MSREVFRTLAEAAHTGTRCTLGILCTVRGSSPQKAGAVAVFFPDGRIVGTLGGGCLEAEAQKLAGDALTSEKPVSFDVVLDRHFRWDDAMICGGRVTGWLIPNPQKVGADYWQELADTKTTLQWGVTSECVFESGALGGGGEWFHRGAVVPPIRLFIAGAGHIAQAVAPLAHSLDFSVLVMDDRPALASTDLFPAGVEVRTAPWDELLTIAPEPPALGLIVTRGHEHDAIVMRAWLHQPFAWLGMIGSSRKARMMREAFVKEGVATEAQVSAVECPVGLEIGAVSPGEIAISITARLIEQRAALLTV